MTSAQQFRFFRLQRFFLYSFSFIILAVFFFASWQPRANGESFMSFAGRVIEKKMCKVTQGKTFDWSSESILKRMMPGQPNCDEFSFIANLSREELDEAVRWAGVWHYRRCVKPKPQE